MICKNVSQNSEYLLFDILLPVEVKYLHLKPRFSVQVNDFYIFERKKNPKYCFQFRFSICCLTLRSSIELKGAGLALRSARLSCYQDFNKPETQRTLFRRLVPPLIWTENE